MASLTLVPEITIFLRKLNVSPFCCCVRLNNMRSVTLSNFIDSSLESKDLPEFLNQLEEIKVSHSNIKSIRSHAFKNVRGLRRLDLSENSISTIENEAFSEVWLHFIELTEDKNASLLCY